MSNILYELLLKEHYIVYFNGQLVITNKFLRVFKEPLPFPVPELKEETAVKPNPPSIFVTPPVSALVVQDPTPITKSPLKELILRSKIPARIATSNGYYYANQYSKPAEKELMKMIAQGVNMDILIAATALYYQGGGARQKVGNYIMDGTWQTFYDDMKLSLEQGNVNAYIKKELGSNEQDGYTKYER